MILARSLKNKLKLKIMTMTQVQINQYLGVDLFKELGMEDVTGEERLIFLEKIGAVMQERLLLRFMKELTEEQKKRLDVILDDSSKDFTAISQFLAREVPNFQRMAEEEIAAYKKELIGRYKTKKQ